MSDWKFGDVLKDNLGIVVMVVGRNDGPEAITTDDHFAVVPGEWLCAALQSNSEKAFPTDGISWMPEDWGWKKVE